MNRNLHRIIFNAARGQRMVVAETATAHGGSPAGTSSSSAAPKPRTAALSIIAFGVLALLAPVLTPAQAQIKADPAAPSSQRPVILAAPNGVPVVNIQTPSAAGISRNTYSQFDIGRPGAILNNSRTNAQSQLGGFIQGNPYLATGPARAILNEVNSANPSLLKGPVEIAGHRADIIIANPAGIKVDGSTFINASSVVLTTGAPVLSSQGSLESYRVVQGAVVIEGLGLDTRTASSTQILARAAEINAGLWANYLQLTLGANDINAADPANPTPITPPSNIPKPAFALDIAAIGGMYAGHIHLVGNEHGLGVKHGGATSAQGQLILLANGKLLNTGMLQAGDEALIRAESIANEGAQAWIAAQKSLTLSAGAGAGEISNSGTIHAGGNASLATPGSLNNAGGLIAANGAMTVHAGSLHNVEGAIASQGTLDLATGELNNSAGYIGAKAALTATAGAVANKAGGVIAGEGAITITATGFDNSGGQVQALGDITLNAGSGVINNTASLIRSAGAVSLKAASVINTFTGDAGQGVQGKDIAIAAASIANSEGAIRADRSITLDAGHGMDNSAGTAIAGQALSITAATLTGGGKLLSKGTLALDLASSFSNTGEITAKGNASIATAGTLTNSGKLLSGATLAVAANTLINTASGEIAGTATHIATSDAIVNRGLIDGQDTRIDAAAVHNIGTGRIYGDHLRVAAGAVVNDAETVGGVTSAGTIAARERLDIGAQTITNRDHALIFSAGDLNIGGALDAAGQATGAAASISNASASIEALGNLTITAAGLSNTNERFSSVLQQGAAVQIIEHAEAGGQRHDASAVRLCDADGCVPGSDIAWLGNRDSRKLLLPSAEFPFERYAAYYARYPAASRDVYDPSCYHGSNQGEAGGCGSTTAGQWYASTDPIWSAFGVTPHTEPEPALDTANGCRQLGQACSVGAIGYQANLGPDNTSFILFPQPITQAQYDEWQTWQAWRQPYDAAHSALDARITAFNASIAPRLRQNWTYWNYSETTSIPVLASSDPGVISAGGDITLALSGAATNAMSRIVAGGSLNVTGVALNNVNAEADSVKVQTGVAVHTYKAACKSCGDDDRVHDAQPYHAEIRGTVALAAAISQGGAATTPTLPATPARGDLPAIVQVGIPAGGALPGITVRTAAVSALAASSLLRAAPDPQAGYLIETDPRFTSYSTWLTSDYMLDALGIKPGETAKRLGDGFIEQRMIREQVANLTGQRFLGDFTSDDAQYQALMEAGATFAKAWNIRPGIALTAEQMAQLTSDIVWLVEQEVALPDGSIANALVPQVYARVRDGDLSPGGALLAGKDVKIDLSGDMANSGTVLGRRLVSLTAQNVQNLGGAIGGEEVDVKAQQDLNVIGGTIKATTKLAAEAGRDLNLHSTTQRTDTVAGNNSSSRTAIDRVAGLYVAGDATGNKALLVATAGRDANIVAAVIANSAKDGQTTLQATRDLNLGAVRQQSSDATTWNDRNQRSQTSSTDIGSQIRAAGSLEMKAGNDINARAATVNAAGALTAEAGRDVNIDAGASSQTVDEAHQYTSRGFLSRKVTTTHDQVSTTGAVGSSLGGETVSIKAGRDIKAVGSAIVSDTGTTLTATRDVTIEAANDTRIESHQSSEKKSGIFGSGGGITLGSRQQSTDTDSQNTTAAASTVGAVAGNVTIKAGNIYTQTGSDVLAPGGDVDILAKDVRITEARETSTTTTEQTFRQSGLSIGIASPLITAAQTVGRMASAAGNTDDSRMQALAAAAGALALKNNAADISKAAKALGEGNLQGAGSLSISLGRSSSQSQTTSTSDTARESSVIAGGNASIRATGAGEASNVVIQGSTVKAGNTLTLDADNKVLLQAARNETTHKSDEKSNSASIGVSIGAGGVGVTASGSASRGNADGQDVYFSNTQVRANAVVIKSGGDTDIRGAVVKADTVKADVKGNLNIESLQDISTYKEQSKSAGASLTVGVGAGGSISAGNTQIDSTYASVGEQSGIRAGDGGFQVDVQGKTNLVGGAITSTSKAVDEGRNHFESKGGLATSDIGNTASHEASSGGFTIGVGGNLKDSGAGAGSKSGSAASITQAAISGIAGNKDARTGDAQSGIAPIFNRDAVERDVKAQTAIFTEFGRQAIPAAASFADQKAVALRREGKEEEAASWDEGGANRTALYGALGLLAGGVSGAAGAVASATLVPTLGEEIAALNLPEPVRQGVTQVMGMAVGAAAGGAAGAATALPQTAFNYVSHSPFANVRLAVSRENARLLNDCGANCTLADLRRMDLQLQKLEVAGNLAEISRKSQLSTEQAVALGESLAALHPVYGTPIALYQAITGESLTGNDLSVAERFFNGVAAAIPAGTAAYKLYGSAIAEMRLTASVGGIVGTDGKALMDFSKLTSEQKGVIGELLGATTVQQMLPGSTRLARMGAVGSQGIDDLYRVTAANVDYVIVEYKFGTSTLKMTDDGMQMSDSWVSSSDRILKAVQSEAEALKIRKAMDAGRVEKWIVHTDSAGGTSVWIVDAIGKIVRANADLTSKVLGAAK